MVHVGDNRISMQESFYTCSATNSADDSGVLLGFAWQRIAKWWRPLNRKPQAQITAAEPPTASVPQQLHR